MTWLWLTLMLVIVGATTAVAAGRGDRLRPSYPDRPDVRLPTRRMVLAQDLTGLRFSVALRGYRMDEVDDVIGRLTREIALRDAELARLTTSSGPNFPDTSDASQPPYAREQASDEQPEASVPQSPVTAWGEDGAEQEHDGGDASDGDERGTA